MLLDPAAKDGSGPSAVTIESGGVLPAFEFVTMDANGNRTAPLHNETWKVGCFFLLLCCLLLLPVEES